MKSKIDLICFLCMVFILVVSIQFEVTTGQAGNLGFVLPESYSNLRIPVRRKTTQRPAYGFGAAFNPIADKGPAPGPPGPFPLEPDNASLFSNGMLPDGGGFVPVLQTQSTTPVLSEEDGFRFNGTLSKRPGGFGVRSGSEADYDTADDYDADEVPEPVDVDVNVQIQSIREIDELNEKLIIELDLTLHWKDYAVFPQVEYYTPEPFENITDLLKNYTSEQMSLDVFNKLWKPDIIVERVVKITRPELLSSPVTIRAIRDTSSIVYTSRVSIKIDCTMSFEYYPADSQHCYLNLRSYQNDITKMNLRWNPRPGAYLVTTDSDDNFDVQLSEVESRKKKVKDINLDDAVFNVLRVKLSMRRKMTYHLVQTYIPSAFLVFITWLSFLVPEELIEARIGVSMTTLLTLTAMFSAVRENTPIVSYVKAIDVWMLYCVIIVFSTLLEFTFFIWLRDYKKSQRQKSLMQMMDSDVNVTSNTRGADKLQRNTEPRSYSIDVVTSKAIASFEKTSMLVNRFAFFLFVLIFVVFNIIYWPWLLVSSEYFQWSVNSTLNGFVEEDDTYITEEL